MTGALQLHHIDVTVNEKVAFPNFCKNLNICTNRVVLDTEYG